MSLCSFSRMLFAKSPVPGGPSTDTPSTTGASEPVTVNRDRSTPAGKLESYCTVRCAARMAASIRWAIVGSFDLLGHHLLHAVRLRAKPGRIGRRGIED